MIVADETEETPSTVIDCAIYWGNSAARQTYLPLRRTYGSIAHKQLSENKDAFYELA